MIAVVVIWTLAGFLGALVLTRIEPVPHPDDRLAILVLATFGGFVVGWICALLFGFADLALRIAS